MSRETEYNPFKVKCASSEDLGLSLTILFAEDEANVRSVLTTFLEIIGYQVTQAANGLEGLNLLKKAKYDLVITDINMPVMSGNELISNIAGLPDPPPVIALCGDIGEVSPNSAVTEIVSKPVSIHTLKAVVQRVLPE